MRDVVVVLFRSSATHSERLAAVAAVSGVVIGGYRTFGGEGYYLVRVRGDTSIRSAKTAVTTLRALGQVEEASLERSHARETVTAMSASAVVQAVPPDSAPNGMFADSNFVSDTTYASVPFLRNVLSVVFSDGTPQALRQTILDGVGGVIIGGNRFSTTNGYYYVRIMSARTVVALVAARDKLRAHPVVDDVHLVYRNITSPNSRFETQHVGGRSDSVPAIAPDSIPVTLLASLPTLTTPNGQTLKAQLVVVLFRREAAAADRARVIAGIGGSVVGGRRTIQGDGWYIVRVPTATTVDSVLSVLDALMLDPSVELAGEYSTSTPSDESWLTLHEGLH